MDRKKKQQKALPKKEAQRKHITKPDGSPPRFRVFGRTFPCPKVN